MASDRVPRNIFAAAPRTTRGVPIVLGGDPSGKHFLYTNRNSVIIRDIENPSVSDIYTQHAKPCLVAKYSPSGFYIASADEGGKVRIWDTTNREHILKAEYPIFAGKIKDLSWSPDSKRIIVGGEGRETYATVFLMDTGSRVGKVAGHIKPVNSVDYRQTRPFRVVSASEDYTVGFTEGPPFDKPTFLTNHKSFVNVVRFDPTGTIFASGGSDGKIVLYDGKSGEVKGELISDIDQNRAHKGGVYGLSFNGDGSRVLTVSADKTAKIWDCSTTQVVTDFTMGKELEDSQVGCLWQNEHLLTVSLSGNINYLDKNNPDQPLNILRGHSNPPTALTVINDGSKFYSGSWDAHIYEWNPSTGVANKLTGKGHTTQIQDMCVNGDDLISVSIDNTVRFTSMSAGEYGTDVLKLDSEPKAVSSVKNITAIACYNEVVVLDKKSVLVTLPNKGFEATAIAVHPDLKQISVGAKNFKVYIYTLQGKSLTLIKEIERSGIITDLSYSPDGQYLCVAAADRKMMIYDAETLQETMKYDALSHTAKLFSVNWAPNSSRVAIGSLDSGISVWNTTEEEQHITRAHAQNAVNRVSWLNDKTIVSAGADCHIKIWDL